MAKRDEIKHQGNSWQYCHHKHMGKGYGLGVVGALFYFIPQSVGFWGVVLAVLKSIVWPAIIVFHLLKFLGA